MHHDLERRLLRAIELNTLVVVCGAGLSVAGPSYLPPASALARACFEAWKAIEELDPSLADDLDRLAGHFYDRGAFDAFIRRVPWNELMGTPNEGHAAIADLLICRAAFAAMSANFDALVEHWAQERKVDMVGALTGPEAQERAATESPLVKFHGCLLQNRQATLWTRSQLQEESVSQRIDSCSQWMKLVLPGKDLLVVGFWSEWKYLNEVFEKAFEVTAARSVTVVDVASAAELEGKAPILWERLNNLSGQFEHVQESGASLLRELRCSFSKVWGARFFDLGQSAIKSSGGTPPPSPNLQGLTVDQLYDLRRDAEGVPYSRAATQRVPQASSSMAAVAQLKLVNAGAIQEGAWWTMAGKSIRVVNGAGQALNDVRARYSEPAVSPHPDVVICASAEDLVVPANLVSSGTSGSVVRPLPGAPSDWMTLDRAVRELGL